MVAIKKKYVILQLNKTKMYESEFILRYLPCTASNPIV